jgi:hypothetical protein
VAQLADACGREPHCCEFESRPEHHRLVAQLGRGNTLRPFSVSVRIRPRPPCAGSPTRQRQPPQKRGLVRIQPGAPGAPVADGEASGFQTRRWVFESPPGCHAPQQQVVSGQAANSVCAVQVRGGAPNSLRGGVDELLKSPVPKTGVSLQGPPRVEFPPPPPIKSEVLIDRWYEEYNEALEFLEEVVYDVTA